jgi:hypothetical protein
MSHWHLRQGVLDAVAEHPATFSEILDASDGAYPIDVLECVSTLVNEGMIETVGDYYVARLPPLPSPMPSESITQHEAELPPPHPLDYDWRFAEETQSLLVATILRTPPARHALLLGAPSMLQRLARTRHLIATARLLDANSALKRSFDGHLPSGFEFVRCNLLTDPFLQPPEPVSVVVADPPWYFAHYAAFLAQAAFAAQRGATILLSLLPLNTRPDAPAERAAIINLASSLGLQLRELRRSALRYVSPKFEQAALNARGLAVREDWRCGDLAVFTVAGPPDRNRLEAARSEAITQDPLVSVDLGWHEFEIGGLKLKLRGPFDDDSYPRLVSVEEGDILPTVSRRYRGRHQIDLWLWDNRVFAVKGKQAFAAALARLSGLAASLDGGVAPEKIRAAEDLVQGLIFAAAVK